MIVIVMFYYYYYYANVRTRIRIYPSIFMTTTKLPASAMYNIVSFRINIVIVIDPSLFGDRRQAIIIYTRACTHFPSPSSLSKRVRTQNVDFECEHEFTQFQLLNCLSCSSLYSADDSNSRLCLYNVHTKQSVRSMCLRDYTITVHVGICPVSRVVNWTTVD